MGWVVDQTWTDCAFEANCDALPRQSPPELPGPPLISSYPVYGGIERQQASRNQKPFERGTTASQKARKASLPYSAPNVVETTRDGDEIGSKSWVLENPDQ